MERQHVITVEQSRHEVAEALHTRHKFAWCERLAMSPHFTLWHSRNTRSLRILWTFKELSLQRGRDYTLHTLKFPPRQHHAEFLERAADIRALLSAGRHSQTDGDGDGRSSQAEARRSIAEVPQARRSSLHGTAV